MWVDVKYTFFLGLSFSLHSFISWLCSSSSSFSFWVSCSIRRWHFSFCKKMWVNTAPSGIMCNTSCSLFTLSALEYTSVFVFIYSNWPFSYSIVSMASEIRITASCLIYLFSLPFFIDSSIWSTIYDLCIKVCSRGHKDNMCMRVCVSMCVLQPHL